LERGPTIKRPRHDHVDEQCGWFGAEFVECASYDAIGIDDDLGMEVLEAGGRCVSKRMERIHKRLTDQPWDPKVDAPLADGIPSITFIGDYFGLDASSFGFYPLFTSTVTGIQELWSAIVPTPLDGPFVGIFSHPVPIQQAILRNLHQCLIAEIAFDSVPIPLGQACRKTSSRNGTSPVTGDCSPKILAASETIPPPDQVFHAPEMPLARPGS
jgi:hypothetical protein